MNSELHYTKEELENKFADNFAIPNFHLLAEIYFQEQDFQRARKVCEIGLENHIDQLDGQYILAKIELLDGNAIKSERILKRIYNSNPEHIQSIKLLIEVRDFLKRSLSETKKLVDFILVNYPDDVFAHQWLSNHYKKFNDMGSNDSTIEIFKVSSNLQSITFYEVLKKQKHYHQALNMLDDLKNTKKINASFYKKESQSINKLIQK
tara:strand:+ start:161 stop:781 length:621 start_codon:yes stop_codon:yes gene_type:complete